MVAIGILLTNCEKDATAIQPHEEILLNESINEPKIENFSLKDLSTDDTFNDLTSTYGILQPQFNTKTKSKSINSILDSLNITIDPNTIKKISSNGYISYTMLMIEPDDKSNDFSNLVIQEKDGIKRIFTFRYKQKVNPTKTKSSSNTPTSAYSYDDIQMQSGINPYDIWYDDSDDGGSGSGGSTGNCEQTKTVCHMVTVAIPVPCGCGHMPGESCIGSTCGYPLYAYYDYQVSEECEEVCDYFPDPSGDPPNDGLTSGPGTSSTDDNSDPTEIATGPVNPDGSCPDGFIKDDEGNCVKDDDCDTSKDDLKKVFPSISDSNASILASLINDKGQDFGIESDEDLWHFLSQAGHETGGFKKLNVTESTYWTTASKLANTYRKFTMDSTLAATNDNKYYAPDYLKNSSGVANVAMCCKYGNGNVESGDGYKYRGRGLFQLTWKDNYSAFKTWYNNKYDPDIDPVTTPSIIASNDTLAVLSGLWYYKTRVVDKIAIDSTTSVSKVTKPINPAKKGLADRKQRFKKAKDSINCL